MKLTKVKASKLLNKNIVQPIVLGLETWKMNEVYLWGKATTSINSTRQVGTPYGARWWAKTVVLCGLSYEPILADHSGILNLPLLFTTIIRLKVIFQCN